MNERDKITISIVTPMSVGEGNEGVWKKGVDYVIHEGKIYHLSIERMVRLGVDLDQLTSLLAEQDEDGLITILGNRLEQASDRIMTSPVEKPGDIRTMIRESLSHRPYIPGSSLKGAIRSALYGEWKEKEDKKESDVFGSMKDGGDFMRFLQIGDAAFEGTGLVNTKIYNLVGQGTEWEGGWKHSMNYSSADFHINGSNTLYECLLPGATAEGSIKIDELNFSHYTLPQPKKDKKNEMMDPEYYPIDYLFDTINKHTFDYLERERQFFLEYPQGEHSEDIVKSINALMHQTNEYIQSGDACLLKMAAGTGFHAITGDWQFPDHINTGFHPATNRNAGKKYIKSRKIACYKKSFVLMGFVKLTKNHN